MSDPGLSWDERWRQARDASAAFNIGSIARDINLPTFALAAVRSANQPRFRYSAPRVESIDGTRLLVVEFHERRRPTLVAGLRGRDVPLEGKVWFTDPDGQVQRTELTVRDRVIPLAEDAGVARSEELMSRITVRFGPDTNVETWVPLLIRPGG
jgi:hypothetical protein